MQPTNSGDTVSTDSPLRLAMWSGPRNISTAMMRAWENRGDTAVVDEPLYAHYLHLTGRIHPGRDETLAAGPTDLSIAIDRLLGPVPGGKRIFYQKHMTHHLLPGSDRNWMRRLTHAFLTRDPREMLTSFLKHVPDATLPDTGYPQQVEIFELVRGWTGRTPPVIDSRDVLQDPQRMLRALCRAMGVEFTERMLSWPPGLRPTDGAWAPYWYKEVETTTSFQPYRPKTEQVPDAFQPLLRQCEEYYRHLHAHRLTV